MTAARKFDEDAGRLTAARMAGDASLSPRIKIVPFGQIGLTAARRYLVKGLVPYPGLTVIWGAPKSGKSFFTFDMLLRVSLGWEYRGRRVHAGPVVYCAFEGASGIAARAEAFRQRELNENDDDVPFHLVALALDLVRDHQNLIEAIRIALGSINPVAVCLDTLNRSLAGSESRDEDMAAYIRACDAIREAFNCAVVVVHHCGVETTRPRGHTSLTGACDAQIKITRDGAGNITAEVEHMKDGAEGETVTSRLEQVDVGFDEDGEPITSCVVLEAEPVEESQRQRQISGAKGVALDLLRNAIIDHGEIPRASNHIPSNTQAVTVSLWREYCYSGTVADSGEPDAKRKAFSRASKQLQNDNLIGSWGDWVWPV